MKKNSYMNEQNILREGLIDTVFDMILGRMDRRRKQQVMKDPIVKRAFNDFWKQYHKTTKAVNTYRASVGLDPTD